MDNPPGRDAWTAANPALGRTVSQQAVSSMLATPDREWLATFNARHVLGLHDMGFAATERAELADAYAAKHIPVRYRGALPTLDAVEKWIADVVRNAQRRGSGIATGTGPSLLLVGATGVGKTHQVYGAMRALALLGIHTPWQVISAADLYARLRPRHGIDSEAEFDRIADAPVLAVDDIGVEKTSPWVEEVNFRLINRRYETCRPSLFTSNLSAPQLAERLGERIASRFTAMTDRVPIKGDDRRRAA